MLPAANSGHQIGSVAMRMFCARPSVVRAGVLAMSLVPATVCLAQAPATPPPATRYNVTVVRIKPDMINEWLDLQKNETIPALKKAGVTNRTVMSTAIGNAFEYVILTPFPKWAEMDAPPAPVRALGAEAAARLRAKTIKCIDVQRNYMLNRVDDLAIPPGTALVSRTTVRRPPPGKMADFMAYQRTDILPLMKKAKADGKIAGYAVSTRGVGAQAGEVTTTIYYNKFADMDAPGGGVSVPAAITAKGAPLSTTVQTVIRRRVADLSF